MNCNCIEDLKESAIKRMIGNKDVVEKETRVSCDQSRLFAGPEKSFKGLALTFSAADLAENDQDAFRDIRQQGLGASDSSVVLDVNPFPDNNIPELLRQKTQKEKTPVEEKIGGLASVRKGRDLEPIILQKFCDKYNVDVVKPPHMYRLKELPRITINYDGLMNIGSQAQAPVEIKLITIYGMKYYTKDKAITNLYEEPIRPHSNEVIMTKYIKDVAKQSGIPVYYYTQLQQQMLGTGSDYAYLVGMDDGNWKILVWKIYRDQKIIDHLKVKAYQVWSKVEHLQD